MITFDLWERRMFYVPKRLREIEKVASDMGVPLWQALGARRAFLAQELAIYATAEVDMWTRAIICWPMERAILEELEQLRKDLHFRNHPIKGNEITPELIFRARPFLPASVCEWSAASCRKYKISNAQTMLLFLRRPERYARHRSPSVPP